MDRKKVLVFHSSSDLYGASNSLLRSLKALKQQQMDPVLVLSEPGPLSEAVAELGVPVHYIRLGVIRRKYVSLTGLFNRMYFIGKAILEIRRLIKQEGFDLALTNTVVIFSGAIASKLSGLRHIWHVRETVVSPKPLKKFILWMLKHTGDAVFFVSQASRDNYLPWLPKEKTQVIYNGIDSSRFLVADHDLKSELGIPKETLVLLMVGRVSYLKGQHYFLEIAKLLLQENGGIHFVLAGDVYPGNEAIANNLRKFIADHQMEAKVTDLGFRTDVARVMAGADIFVLPSVLPDSLPTTVLEAMAAAKPVVATDLGGAREMVSEGETGFLIPGDDAAFAAKTLQRLIDDSDLRKRMGEQGRVIVLERFSLQGYLSHFGEAVSRQLPK
ncbi:MAG: glycosyltransferase [Lunatimonas sp.]|uniref:glycosyltransferase n=1 Tax=Lunatimonas sp. TaxID=2060141 RepID=UPI00263AEC15|nr:glycosyltransferase [Lunatimonas sp.]MCC5938447.1 glycosyltransferase [Lunatimonas sp.]